MVWFQRPEDSSSAAQQAIENTARRLVDVVRRSLDNREHLVPVRPSDFPALDLAFYDSLDPEIEAAGFRVLGDFGDEHVAELPAGKRSFYRIALDRDAAIVASWFASPSGPARCTVLHSWLEDGRVCVTTRGVTDSGIPHPPEHVSAPVPPATATADMIEHHRQSLATLGGTPRHLTGIADISAAREADAARTTAFRMQEGITLFEPMLRKKFGDEYDRRGRPLVDAIARHPEWWTQTPESPPAGTRQGIPQGIGMSPTHPHQLGVPPEPLSNPDAFEVARVWSSAGHQLYVLDVARYDDPAVWGLLALDVMKHAARAYEQLDGRSRVETYNRILAGFMAEMQSPTEQL